VRNGHVRRITDEDIGSAALEICGNNVSTTTVTCPEEDRQTLGGAVGLVGSLRVFSPQL